MKQTFRDHPYAVTGFLLAATITLFFLIRMVVAVIYWSNPAHHNETAKPWMTVGYVAHSWHLDAAQIDQLAGLPGPKGHGPWTLQQMADARSVPVAEIIKLVNETVATLEAQKVKP
ncbi:MAG: hypothetical protein ABI832_03155 [bacterium]